MHNIPYFVVAFFVYFAIYSVMRPEKMSYEAFCVHQNVPRGTFLKLEKYTETLLHWQKKINLISADTASLLWERHVLDSCQLFPYIASDVPVFDMGSGAGFPGMVLAILGIKNISLVESDGRKIAFLREAARETSANVTIIHDRVENVSFSENAVIVARAFAPLERILSSVEKNLKVTNSLLLLKGKSSEREVSEARKYWAFSMEKHPSKIHPEGVILSISHPTKEVSYATS